MSAGLRRKRLLTELITIALILVLVATLSGTLLAEIPVAVVKGSSMLPLLREGDIVIVLKCGPGDIRVGDVIVFRTQTGRLVVHRVVGVKVGEDGTYYYVTQGDNNAFPDFQHFERGLGVPYWRVVGKVASVNDFVFKVPYLGHLALMIRGE